MGSLGPGSAAARGTDALGASVSSRSWAWRHPVLIASRVFALIKGMFSAICCGGGCKDFWNYQYVVDFFDGAAPEVAVGDASALSLIQCATVALLAI